MHVTLRDRAHAILEQGAATKVHELWSYRAQTTSLPGEAVTIEAAARDRPGHAGYASLVWLPPAST